MNRRAILQGLLVPTLVVLGTSGCEGPTNPDLDELNEAPTIGRLQVTTTTRGSPLAGDHYVVLVDGAEAETIGLNGTVTLARSVAAGEHEVKLTGLASNCSALIGNPQMVMVASDETASVSFEVECAPMGWIKVTAITTGSVLDPNGYTVEVDGEAEGSIGINETLTLAALREGERRVELTGLASNCAVDGANPRTVMVVAKGTVAVSFGVSCVFVPRKIAFTSGRDPSHGGGGAEIYAMSAGGANVARLTSLGVWGDPAWSPDGAKIAFTRDEDGWFDMHVYVMNADGSNPVRISNDSLGGSGPVWSPDGSRIAFAASHDGNYDVYTMNADGSDPVNLTSHPANSWAPAWSPDGSRIAFTRYEDGDPELYVMGADGSNPTNLTNHPGFDSHAAWSPDGTRIAFSSNRDGELNVYVMNVDGSNPVRLTDGPANDYDPAWSPDGTKIAFTTDRDGNLEVYVMDADGSNPVNVTNHPAWDDRPAWSR